MKRQPWEYGESYKDAAGKEHIESAAAFSAFQVFLDLPTPEIDQVLVVYECLKEAKKAEKIPTKKTLYTWSSDFNWSTRYALRKSYKAGKALKQAEDSFKLRIPNLIDKLSDTAEHFVDIAKSKPNDDSSVETALDAVVTCLNQVQSIFSGLKSESESSNPSKPKGFMVRKKT